MWRAWSQKIGTHCSDTRLRGSQTVKPLQKHFHIPKLLSFSLFLIPEIEIRFITPKPRIPIEWERRDGFEPASLVHSSPVEGVGGSHGSVLGWLHTGSSALLAFHGGVSRCQPLHLRRRRRLLLLPCMRL